MNSGMDSDNFTSSDDDSMNYCSLTGICELTLKLLVQLPIAILFTGIFSLLVRRKSLLVDVCNGRGALAPPVKFFERSKDSPVVLALFVLISFDGYIAYTVVNDGDFKSTSYKVAFQLLVVFVISICCLPLFLSLSINSVASLSLGLVYLVIVVIITILETIMVQMLGFQAHQNVQITSTVIRIACILYITFEYGRKIVKKKNLLQMEVDSDELFDDGVVYEKEYVRRLLTHSPRPESEDNFAVLRTPFHSLRLLFEKYIYKNIPGFRYSLYVLVSVILGLLIAFFMLISCLSGIRSVQLCLHEIVKNYAQPIYSSFNLSSSYDKIETIITDQIELTAWCLYLSSVVAYVLAVIFALQILKSYRRYVSDSRRHQRSLGTVQVEGLSNTKIVFLSLQFSGFQIASIFLGFWCHFFWLWLMMFVVSEIFYPLKFGSWIWIRMIFYRCWPWALTIAVVMGIQFLLLKFVFLHERGRILALRHRKGFYALMYFVFFYNILTGALRATVRLILSFVITFCLLPRLDRPIIPFGLQKYDTGYLAYLCFGKLESTVNNPIAKCFVHLLLRHKDFVDFNTEEISSKKNRRLRRRWWVVYTLIRNPSLKTPPSAFSSHPHLIQPRSGMQELHSVV